MCMAEDTNMLRVGSVRPVGGRAISEDAARPVGGSDLLQDVLDEVGGQHHELSNDYPELSEQRLQRPV